MRFRHLFLTSALGALILASTPGNSQACCWGWGGGWGGGYGYRAAPMYAPPAYSVAPRPLPPMPAPRPTAMATVSAGDEKFDPATLTVQPGTTVRFVNNGKHVHTFTSNDGKFDSRDVPPGGTFSAMFMSPGTYKYHCNHHKGMEGTIVVAPPAKATK